MKSEVGVGTKIAFLVDMNENILPNRSEIEKLFITEFHNSPI